MEETSPTPVLPSDQQAVHANTQQAPAEAKPFVAPRGRIWRWIVGLGLVTCMIGGGVAWWYAGLRNYFFPDNFGVVEPGKIYRSAQIHQRILRETLVDHNIKVIVDLSDEDSADAQAEKQIAADLGVERIAIPGLGGKGVGDPDAYPKAIEAIVHANRDGKAVLVHCQSGAQRTGGVIATYRMLVQGRSEEEAFAEAKRFHYRPSQNPHLVPFVEKHLEEWRKKLAAEEGTPIR